VKKLILIAGVATLAACSPAETDAEPEAMAEAEAPVAAEHAAGSYTFTEEGAASGSYTTNEDGTYSLTSDDGELSGTYTQDGAQTCFDPEGEGENLDNECWVRGEAAEDGSFTATSED